MDNNTPWLTVLKSVKKPVGNHTEHRCGKYYGEYQLVGIELIHRFLFCPENPPLYYSSLSRPNAECSTRTASSVYFSSIMQEIRISDVLIIIMLMFS
jgi:hypothetical protein